MKYMLLIHQGDAPTPRDQEAWQRLSEDEQKAGLRRLPGDQPDTGSEPGPAAGIARGRDHGARGGRQDADHRRAVRHRQGGPGRLAAVRGRRPRRRDRARVANPGGAPWRRRRGAASRGVTTPPRADLPRRVGPCPRHPDRLPRRLRARRGGRSGRVRDRRRALASGGDAGQPAGLAGDDRAKPRDRPDPARPHARAEAPAARPARRT